MSLAPQRLHSWTANPRKKSRGVRAAPAFKLWIYDLRTNQHFTLKENTLKRTDLDDFVDCYFGRARPLGAPQTDGPAVRPYQSRHERKETECFNPDKSGANRFEREESERFRSFTYAELIKRDKHSSPKANVPGFPRHTRKLGASRRKARRGER